MSINYLLLGFILFCRYFMIRSRRVPQAIVLDLANPTHWEAIRIGARLRLRVFGGGDYSDEELYNGMLIYRDNRVLEKKFTVLSAAEKLGKIVSAIEANADDHNSLKSLQERICPEEFEKDDLRLGHVTYVQLYANLRSQVYGLKELDTLAVRKVIASLRSIVPFFALLHIICGLFGI